MTCCRATPTRRAAPWAAFVINSTVGLGGLIDVAAKAGIPDHDNDFGITLGKAGAAEGSYLVLPFAGPKPPRDLVGAGVDIAFNPLLYINWGGANLFGIITAGWACWMTAPPISTASIRSSVRRSTSMPPPAASIASIAPPRSMDGKANIEDLPNY